MCQYLIEQVASDVDYLNDTITANETWIYCYNPALKPQMSEWVPWGFSHLLKPCTTKSKMKCIVITFFSKEGLVYTHTVPDGQTVDVDCMSKSWGGLLWRVHTCEPNHSCTKCLYVWMWLHTCAALSVNGSCTIHHKPKFVGFLHEHKGHCEHHIDWVFHVCEPPACCLSF